MHPKMQLNGTDLWHCRLGHVGRETVKSMSGRHVEGMDISVSARSETCEPFPRALQTKYPATGRLAQLEDDHIVHSDNFGPIHPQTSAKSTYIIKFTAERSRLAKFNTIKPRSELHDCLALFRAWLERKTSKKVKQSHSYQAIKYVSLGEHFRQERIMQTMSSAYSLKSDGVAE